MVFFVPFQKKPPKKGSWFKSALAALSSILTHLPIITYRKMSETADERPKGEMYLPNCKKQLQNLKINDACGI
jgi:hypothetical protein